MGNLMTKVKTGLLITAGAVFTGVASAQETSAVADAASSFASEWAVNAAIVGGVLIAAAFLAIGFKWVKGMVFS